jgi:hypothetical protein
MCCMVRKKPMRFPCCMASANNYICDCRERGRIRRTALDKLEELAIARGVEDPDWKKVLELVHQLRKSKGRE